MGNTERALQAIRHLRKINGYSLETVAKGIGYGTYKGYYDLESGKTDIKLEHLVKLAEFYQVPMAFFLEYNSTEKVQKYLDAQTG
jgi:transcriptional regulator with XRE-family HTH domain